MKKNIVFLLLIYSFFQACNYHKRLTTLSYFIDNADSSHAIVNEIPNVIKKGDRLAITVYALNPESTIPFNGPSGTGASGSTATSSGSTGFLVENDGTILYPLLGKIYVEGKTIIDFRDELMKMLNKYLTDPIVVINNTTYKRINVMGEVTKPGIVPMVDGRLTILEAINASGDIPPTGNRDSVLVIRESNGIRKFQFVNLQKHDIYKSEYYNLQPNDLVYVKPNIQKAKDVALAELVKSVTPITTFTTTISFLFVLINLFRR